MDGLLFKECELFAVNGDGHRIGRLSGVCATSGSDARTKNGRHVYGKGRRCRWGARHQRSTYDGGGVRWLAARQSAVSASESADGRIDQRAAAPTAAERGRPEFIYRRGQWSAQQRPAARSVRPRRLRR